MPSKVSFSAFKAMLVINYMGDSFLGIIAIISSSLIVSLYVIWWETVQHGW